MDTGLGVGSTEWETIGNGTVMSANWCVTKGSGSSVSLLSICSMPFSRIIRLCPSPHKI